MKTQISILLWVTIFSVAQLASCSGGVQKTDNDQYLRDSLLHAQEDSLLNLYRAELEAIARKVGDVGAEHGILDFTTNEGVSADKEAVIKRIEALNELLKNNQKELADLRKRIKGSNVKNTELNNLLKSMEAQIAQRETQMKQLLEMLAEKDAKIESIMQRMDSMRINKIELLEDMIKMEHEMHMVYYLVAEFSELKEKGLITKEGGVLGIGASRKLNASNLDPTLFRSADQRDLTNIPLFSKKARIISSHPEGSYEVKLNSKGETETLEIKDRTKFWMATDFLVVEVSN